jgi:D-tyrosyl-tRNA(Tyr) deacylase
VRAVVQRVRSAQVTVGDTCVTEMGAGLLALVGVGRADDEASARALALRPQFTLFGDARQGRRPSYAEAAPAETAEPLIEVVAAAAREHGIAVVTGRFGAMMDVMLVNDGPVTILLATERRF